MGAKRTHVNGPDACDGPKTPSPSLPPALGDNASLPDRSDACRLTVIAATVGSDSSSFNSNTRNARGCGKSRNSRQLPPMHPKVTRHVVATRSQVLATESRSPSAAELLPTLGGLSSMQSIARRREGYHAQPLRSARRVLRPPWEPSCFPSPGSVNASRDVSHQIWHGLAEQKRQRSIILQDRAS